MRLNITISSALAGLSLVTALPLHSSPAEASNKSMDSVVETLARTIKEHIGTQLFHSIYVTKLGDAPADVVTKFNTTVPALEEANPKLELHHFEGRIYEIPPPVPAGSIHKSLAKHTFEKIAAKNSTTTAIRVNTKLNTLAIHEAGLNNNYNTTVPVIHSPTIFPRHEYVKYSGPASTFPAFRSWRTYEDLWDTNSQLMADHDSPSEIATIRRVIPWVARQAGLDPRFVLAIIMQESGGNVRAPDNEKSVVKTGLMQAHNGGHFNPDDPDGSITEMIRDGVFGTDSGDGLMKGFARFGDYYLAARMYNSGGVRTANVSDGLGATDSYASDVANRLYGWLN